MKRFGRNLRKTLALALCLILVLQAVPAAVLAADAGAGLVITQVTPERAPVEGKGALASGDELADPEELVEMIVELERAPVAEMYPMQTARISDSREAEAYSAELYSEQAQVQAAMQSRIGGTAELTHSYTQLVNGFAVCTARKNLAVLRSLPGVRAAYIAGVYEAPSPEAGDKNAVALTQAVNSLGYTGKGLTVAVLDTGLDYNHPAFATAPTEPSYNKDTVASVLERLKAAELCEGLTAAALYKSEKVPFAFDYAVHDADTTPATKLEARDQSHGTHVAGIIAGYEVNKEGEVVFSGVAPDAQLVGMKVFDDNGQGAKTTDILTALEDAYTLKVDVINLSLGIRSGFSTAEEETIASVYNKLEEAGILVVAAAGNDTSASYMNKFGEDLAVATDPDNGIVGSPSSYTDVLSVASVNNDNEYYYAMEVNGERIAFTDATNSIFDVADRAQLLYGSGYLPELPEPPYELVAVPGVGNYDDYYDENYNLIADVTGKIAVIARGEISFSDKAFYAGSRNAIGVIIYNNDAEHPDDYSVAMDVSGSTVPACFISYNDGQKLLAMMNGEGEAPCGNFLPGLNEKVSAQGGEISSFSSIGVTPDLRLKPEVSGIGGNVKSTVPTLAGKGDYMVMSGTSMASPYVAGVTALVLERLNTAASPAFRIMGKTAAAEALVMSTAEIVRDENGVPYTPRLQGAGLANMQAALESPVYLYTDADSFGDVKPVANLGDDPAHTGSYTVTFHAANISDTDVTYDINAIALTPEYLTRDGYALMGDTEHELDITLEGDTSVTIPAGGSREITVTVAVNDTDYLAQYENGIYVEGYVCLTAEEAPTLSIPFLSFFGEWTRAGVLDYATYLDEEVDSTDIPGYVNDFSGIVGQIGETMVYAYYLGVNLMTNVPVRPTAEHAVISPNGDYWMDAVDYVNLALLRSACAARFFVTDAAGNEVWSQETSDIPKTSYSAAAGQMLSATLHGGYGPEPWYGVDNEGNALPDGQYVYHVVVDPVPATGNSAEENHNLRNTLDFPVYVDTQKPVLVTSTVTLKEVDGRLMLGLPVKDEHMLLGVEAYPINSWNNSPNMYAPLLNNAAGEGIFGLDGVDVAEGLVEVDVTDYAGQTIYVAVNDWGYNKMAYHVEIPGQTPEGTLALSDETLIVPTGETEQLLCINNQALENLAVTWSSNDETVATVDQDGLVLGVAEGQTVVTATASNGKSVSCIVGVYDPLACTGIRLAYDECTIQPKMHPSLPTIYLEPYGFVIPAESATWTSDNPEVAEMQMSFLPLLYTEKEGTAVFTVAYGGFTTTLTVNVEPLNGSVNLSYFSYIDYWGELAYLYPTALYMYKEGQTTMLSAEDADVEEGDVLIYSVDDPTIVSLSKTKGPATHNNGDGPFATALRAGTTCVHATAKDGDSFTWIFVVEPLRYSGIETVQRVVSLKQGETFNALDAVSLLGENVIAEENPVFFRSFAPDVASVEENGLITANAGGTALIWVLLNTGDYTLFCVEVEAKTPVVPDKPDVPVEPVDPVYPPAPPVNPRPTNPSKPDPTDPVVPSPVFRDVKIDAWYGEAVQFAAGKNLIQGVGDNCFNPGGTLTRAQLVTILYRMSGEPSVTGRNTFADVVSGAFYERAVIWANGCGVVKGISETLFAPDASLTRQDMAVILYRYAQQSGKDVDASGSLSAFPDAAAVTSYAAEAMSWAVGSDLLHGVAQLDGTALLAPKAYTSRAEMAMLLMRFDAWMNQ